VPSERMLGRPISPNVCVLTACSSPYGGSNSHICERFTETTQLSTTPCIQDQRAIDNFISPPHNETKLS
jgi:hypothetical protein